MVHPIRAAACPAWRICCAIDSPLWCRRPWQTHAWRVGAGRGHLSPAEGARGGPGWVRPAWWTSRATDCPPPAFQPTVDRSRLWQPWPVEPPFADRVELHWPSDDWPPLLPAPTIEDRVPDAPVQVILWRDTGGLLDMWA